MSDSATPGWLKGLIIVFGCTSVLTFGLFVYRHSEDTAYFEQYRDLVAERDALKVYLPKLKTLTEGAPAPLDQAIMTRRARMKEIAEVESQTRGDVDRLVGEASVKAQTIASLAQAEGKKYEQLVGDARSRRMELHQEEDRALALERDLDDRRLRAREQLELQSQTLEELKRTARNQKGVLDERVDELDDRILQLTEQRELNNRELKADGQVLAARATDGFLVVDRGFQSNVRKGMKFTVFNRRGGRNFIKGQVEVVEVDARTSVCRVLEEKDSNDPLIPGDKIHNPVYNPSETKIFVLAGDFTRFSKEELTRFITESGGRVDKELSTASDYLVAGTRAEGALNQASKLGISILSESQALELMRYTPKFLVTEGMTVAMRGRFTAVSAGKIENFIERSGGKVISRIDANTQVLIAGEGAEADIATARSLGLTVVGQAQFTHLND
jgi:NAD-dependent DNA ligase